MEQEVPSRSLRTVYPTVSCTTAAYNFLFVAKIVSSFRLDCRFVFLFAKKIDLNSRRLPIMLLSDVFLDTIRVGIYSLFSESRAVAINKMSTVLQGSKICTRCFCVVSVSYAYNKKKKKKESRAIHFHSTSSFDIIVPTWLRLCKRRVWQPGVTCNKRRN